MEKQLINDTTMSQKQMLLHHLQNVGPIEPRTALNEYGIYRLGSRICDLRQDGYEIRTEMIARTNQRGKVVHVARYTLVDGENENNGDTLS